MLVSCLMFPACYLSRQLPLPSTLRDLHPPTRSPTHPPCNSRCAGWFKQTVNDPTASLSAERRGTVSLPDIESSFAGGKTRYSAKASSTQHNSSTTTLDACRTADLSLCLPARLLLHNNPSLPVDAAACQPSLSPPPLLYPPLPAAGPWRPC